MSVTDANTHKDAEFVKRHLSVARATVGNNEAATPIRRIRPGHPFQITDVQAWAEDITATATIDVLVGNDTDGFTSVLDAALTPVAGEVAVASLVDAITSRRGGAADEIEVQVTTNGTGDLTNLEALVKYRKNPLNGESSHA